MKSTQISRHLLIGILALGCGHAAMPFSTTASAAAPADDQSMESLQKRFESRLPELRKFKSAGAIGETYKGFVDFVKDRNADAQDVVRAENDDRTALYKLIAKKEKATPDLVATRNAQRNFEKAKAGEYLQLPNGKWEKKS